MALCVDEWNWWRMRISMVDPFPKHPVNERKAELFHWFAAGVCALHLVVGLLGGWYHVTGALRHRKAK